MRAPDLRRPFLALLALCVVVAAFSLFASSRTSLWDRDEPRFARAAVEMVESGQYLYPTFNGKLRPDKPILIYWLMSVPIRLFGPSEVAVRLWSALGQAVAAAATFVIGRKLFDARTGWLAAAILATTPLAFAESVLATTDAVLLGCVSVALACFVVGIVDGTRALHVIGVTLALAAAELVKGPIGLAAPLLAIGAALIVGRELPGLRPWRGALFVAALVSVAVFVAWAYPANRATHGQFASEGLGHHVLDRVLHPLEGHGGSYALGLFFYLPIVWLGFAPWTLYVPATIAALVARETFTPRERAVLWGWITTTFVMVSLVATKLPHYVLPLFPALALGVARVVVKAETNELGPRTRTWLARGVWFFAPLVVVELGALGWIGGREPSTRVGCVLLAAIGVVAAWLALARARRGAHFAAARALGGGSVASALVLAFAVLPQLDARKPVPPLAAAIRASTVGPIATYDFDEPSLAFYVGRSPVRKFTDAHAALEWCKWNRPGVLVASRKGFDELAPELEALGGREIARSSGFNFARGKEIELVAFELESPTTR
ncbi:MAG: glycosyltransferase family 39 protein [Planctomycetes bacterium]|nr:glycosyltransferase family 39 protein [Planctomycetota bacterium]